MITLTLRDAVQTMEQGNIEVPYINDDADKIRSTNYETVFKLRIFLGFTPQPFSRSEHSVCKLIDALKVERSCLIRIAFCQTNRRFILMERAEMKICISMANGMLKTKMNIATVPDLYLTSANILTHLISRY